MLSHFTDPLLRGPLIASMLMCLTSALIGTVVFVRRHTLIGETLAHASYPGALIGALIATTFFKEHIEPLLLIGGACSAWLGLKCTYALEKRLFVNKDASLCFILVSFFGIGLLIVSRVQILQPTTYKTMHSFLYGQVATMTDFHILIYALFASITLGLITLFYRPIQWTCFDPGFVTSIGKNTAFVHTIISFLLICNIAMGIRCTGIILMSGMLIAPPLAARQWTHRLSTLFFLSATFGALSGYLGTLLSWNMSQKILPTGPMILLVASTLALIALLFSPKKGLLLQAIRIALFKDRCKIENLLKLMWKQREEPNTTATPSRLLLWRLKKEGFIFKNKNGSYHLTEEGMHRAERIVRLHRLWESYLVHLGQKPDSVHPHAEHMEHILTPHIETELTTLLDHPDADPHKQPIPTKRSL